MRKGTHHEGYGLLFSFESQINLRRAVGVPIDTKLTSSSEVPQPTQYTHQEMQQLTRKATTKLENLYFILTIVLL